MKISGSSSSSTSGTPDLQGVGDGEAAAKLGSRLSAPLQRNYLKSDCEGGGRARSVAGEGAVAGGCSTGVEIDLQEAEARVDLQEAEAGVDLQEAVIALLLVRFDTFDAAPYSSNELAKKPISAIPLINPRLLHGSEKIGKGELLAPEDIVYDPELGVIYTGCVDGWIKRVRVNDSVVDEWVNTGGRPLGLALGYSGEVYFADAFKEPIVSQKIE
ncbi:hypothetical protein LXL04_002263 [Taraxacum kok-saghyz]